MVTEKEHSKKKSSLIFQKVQNHAEQTLDWMQKDQKLFDIALNNLILGRTLLLKNSSNYKKIETYLNNAVEKLSNSNRFDYLPYSLIIRSIFYHKMKRLDESKKDLDEALKLAESSKIKIYQADAHLGFVRFYKEKEKFNEAHKCLERAKRLIKQMNYNRQKWRVEDLEKILPKN